MEYTMQANLSHCEDIAELEDDILCFLPTVSELDVFGCELELLNLQTQQPLPEAFRTELLHRPQLQIVVRPCMADGHSIWQFQDDRKESCPKAVRVPPNPRGAIADRAFYAAPLLRHVEVATGIQHIGIAAWQSCQQLQIVKLPTSVVSLADMLSRVASRLQQSPLTRIVRINHEHCLKAHSVEQALSSCACRMTFTTSGRGPVKIAKV